MKSMTRFVVILSVFTIYIILEVQAQNLTTETSAGNTTVTNSTTSDNRKISRRHLRTLYVGKSNNNNYNRNRPNRNKRRRKPKPRRPQNFINHDSSFSTDFEDVDFKKHLQEDRRNRYEKHREQLESYEDYLKHPDLGNLGHVFDKDEIKDLFLTTNFDYNKLVRDYNTKLKESGRPKKTKRPSKYRNEYFDDSEGTYDFSEYGNSDSSDPFYKHHSKFKKNDATQQLSPVLQYEHDNLKDFGAHQNSYGEYTNPGSENDNGGGTYTYTMPPEENYEDARDEMNHFDDENYTLELLKTFKKNNTKSIKTTNDLYPNHAPTYSNNYGNTYSFDTKPVEKTKKYSFDTLIPNDIPNYSTNNNGYNLDKFTTQGIKSAVDKSKNLSFDTFPNDIPSFSKNHATGYNFDKKPTIDTSSPTKYTLSEWNVKHGGEYLPEFDNRKRNPLSSNPVREFSEHEHKDFSVDVVKQFYEMNNNFHTPSYTTGITVTSKPISYDQNNYLSTKSYDLNDNGFWKDDGGWKVLDTNSPGGSQFPMDIPHPIIVPVPQPYPVRVPVTKPVAVPVVREIKVPVEKEVPYPVVKNVPYPVEKPVPVKVEKQVKVAVPKPYPVQIPIVKNIYYHSHGTPAHTDDWNSGPERERERERDHRGNYQENHEAWEDDGPASFEYEEVVEEETVPKESQRHLWRNGRPTTKKSKRKNNNAQFEDYEIEEYNNFRPKKRSPPRPVEKNRDGHRNSGRNRGQSRRKKNPNRNRSRKGTKRLIITRRQSDDDLK